MASVKLSAYIMKIDNAYQSARAKYESIVKDMQAENERFKKVNKEHYTSIGYNALEVEHLKKIESLKADLENVSKDFNADVETVIANSDALFDRKYCYTPKDIDPNGITILEHGHPGEHEIKKLADSYLNAGNSTMYFMCAEKLKDSKDPAYSSYYANAMRMRDARPDHDLLQSMVYYCNAGLRTTSSYSNNLEESIDASQGVHNKHADLINDILENAEQISVAVEDPFN